MESHEIRWNLMESDEIPRNPTESWNPMESHGIGWNPTESWNPNEFKESKRIQRNPKEPNRIQRNPVESSGILRNHIVSRNCKLISFDIYFRLRLVDTRK